MPRIRTVKPEIWMSPQVMNLSHGARLLFLGLITQADDEGRGSADARKLKASIFGGDDYTSTDVRRWLDECTAQGLADVYLSEKHGVLYALPSWRSHQSIDRPRKSAYPTREEAESARRIVVEPNTKPREGSDRTGPEWNGREGNVPHAHARAIPPDDVTFAPDVRHEATPLARTRTFDDGELMDAFVVVKSTYPKFTGRQDWPNAEHHWRMRVEQGVEPAQLLAGVERYAAFVDAGGVSGSAFVMTPGKFFSATDKPWSQAWDPPLGKAETRLAGNLTAAEEFMRRTEPAA
jgi:hypothetical protein